MSGIRISATINEAVRKLFLGNLAQRLRAGETNIEQWEVPDRLRTVGYTGAAKILGISSAGVRHYWRNDLQRGFSQGMPEPDVIIERIIAKADGTEVTEILPGWTPETIIGWMPYRVGIGNHTRKDGPLGRQGNDKGRTGWRKNRDSAAATEEVPAE